MQNRACKQDREVEPALWKSVFYRPIEEFRRRIKAAAAAGDKGKEPLRKVSPSFRQHVGTSVSPARRLCATGLTGPCASTPYRHVVLMLAHKHWTDHFTCVQVKIAFGKFLQDAALFYRQLACKLQAAYGSVGFSLADAQLQSPPHLPEQQYKQQDCRQSVYRCLICLGDIFRYALQKGTIHALYHDCFGYQDHLSCIELSLLKGNTTVRMR